MLFFFLPEREIFLEELDDGFGISEGFFINVIDLLEGIGEGFLTKFAGLLVVVHDLVVEHGEVKSKSESNWVARVEGLRACLGQLVVLKGSILDTFELISLGALSNVSIVISNHFVEERFGFVSGGNFHALVFDVINDGHALIIKLSLNLLLVNLEGLIELLVLWILLNSADGSNGSSLGSDLVFETDRQKISLFGGEVFSLVLNDLIKIEDHVVKSFGLLSNSSHENVFFQTHFVISLRL